MWPAGPTEGTAGLGQGPKQANGAVPEERHDEQEDWQGLGGRQADALPKRHIATDLQRLPCLVPPGDRRRPPAKKTPGF